LKRKKAISDDKEGEQDIFAIPESPTKKSKQQPTSNNQRATTNEQQPTSNNQRATTNEQQPTSNNQRATTNEQ
jgi:hypothetical protein